MARRRKGPKRDARRVRLCVIHPESWPETEVFGRIYISTAACVNKTLGNRKVQSIPSPRHLFPYDNVCWFSVTFSGVTFPVWRILFLCIVPVCGIIHGWLISISHSETPHTESGPKLGPWSVSTRTLPDVARLNFSDYSTHCCLLNFKVRIYLSDVREFVGIFLWPVSRVRDVLEPYPWRLLPAGLVSCCCFPPWSVRYRMNEGRKYGKGKNVFYASWCLRVEERGEKMKKCLSECFFLADDFVVVCLGLFRPEIVAAHTDRVWSPGQFHVCVVRAVFHGIAGNAKLSVRGPTEAVGERGGRKTVQGTVSLNARSRFVFEFFFSRIVVHLKAGDYLQSQGSMWKSGGFWQKWSFVYSIF